MRTRSTLLPSLLSLIILFLPSFLSIDGGLIRFAKGSTKRRVHIPDDLDDVIDDEEDRAWKEWGKKPTPSPDFDPPPSDFSKLKLSEIQALMMKRHSGPVFGFVKLRLGFRRTRDMVAEIAMKWTNLLKTGALGARFMGVDVSTIMFTMERGQDTEELREFILEQSEAYEIKIGDQVYRRPGDPPLDEVFEKLQSEKNKADKVGNEENDKHLKEEL